MKGKRGRPRKEVAEAKNNADAKKIFVVLANTEVNGEDIRNGSFAKKLFDEAYSIRAFNSKIEALDSFIQNNDEFVIEVTVNRVMSDKIFAKDEIVDVNF